MKALIVAGIIVVVFLVGLMTWSLCAAAGRQDDDDEQLRCMREMKNKDDDMPM